MDYQQLEEPTQNKKKSKKRAASERDMATEGNTIDVGKERMLYSKLF